MVRKMAVIGLSYLFGLFFAPFFRTDLALVAGVGCVLLGILLYIAFRKSTRVWLGTAMIAAACAFCVHSAYEYMVYRPVIAHDGTQTTLSGTLLQLNDLSADTSLYLVQTQLSGHNVKVGIYAPQGMAQPYDTVEATVRLYVPQDTVAFPQKYYYKSQGVFLFANAVGEMEFTVPANKPLQYHIQRYAQDIKLLIRNFLPGEEGAALIAVLFGDKSLLLDQTRLSLQRAGAAHLVAVSGLHLAIVTGLFAALLARTRLRKWLQVLLILALLAVFTIFTGMSVSAMRAAVMLAIYHFAVLLRRRGDTLSSLGIAALILTAVQPYAARDTGFLLSMLGVIGVGPVGGAMDRAVGGVLARRFQQSFPLKGVLVYLRSAIVRSFGASLCTFPIALMTFDEVSIIAPLSNILLIPLCTLALVCGVLLTITGGIALLAAPLCFVAGICMRLMLWTAGVIGRWRISYIASTDGYLLVWVLLTILGLLALRAAFRTWRFSGLVGLASVGVLLCGSFMSSVSEQGELQIAVLSDGENGAVVCTQDGTAWVLKADGGSAGLAKQVGTYLQMQNVQELALFAAPAMQQSEVPLYTSLLQKAHTAILPEKITQQNTGVEAFDILQIYSPRDMEISLGNRYNISITMQGESADFLLADDNGFSLLYTQAARAGLQERAFCDIMVISGKRSDALYITQAKYAVLLHKSQLIEPSSGVLAYYPYTQSQMVFAVRGGNVSERRWGVYALY